MKQRMKQFRKLLLPLLIATLLFQTQALAADYSCTISIPVEVQVTGDSAPDDVDFTVTMTPVDEATKEMCGRVIYPAAVMKAAPNADAAKAFLAYLQTEEAMTVFEGVGFSAVAQ